MQSSVFLVGKLVHWQEDVHTLPAGPSTSSPLIYLQDSLSSRRFLIDSGASFPAPRLCLKIQGSVASHENIDDDKGTEVFPKEIRFFFHSSLQSNVEDRRDF